MRTALILTPSSHLIMPPIGLCSISSWLQREGHDVEVLDINRFLYDRVSSAEQRTWEEIFMDPEKLEKFFREHDDLIEDALKNIMKNSPELLGFSVFFTTELSSLEFAKRIKERAEETFIVFGGPQCHRIWGGKRLINNNE